MNLKSDQVRQILDEYPHVKAAVLAEKYNVPVKKIYSTAKRYSVKKSPEFLSSDQSGRIKEGQHFAPDTEIKKGQRIPGPRIRNKPKQPHPTAWRKGNVPPNTAENGEIRWRTVGWMIRIDQNDWMYYTRWLWIKNHHEIPEGYNVVYKQGCSISKYQIPTIEQLQCISNADLISINSGRDELTEGYILSKLSHMKPQLKQAFSKMPELIELKRTQIKLRRIINEHSEIKAND